MSATQSTTRGILESDFRSITQVTSLKQHQERMEKRQKSTHKKLWNKVMQEHAADVSFKRPKHKIIHVCSKPDHTNSNPDICMQLKHLVISKLVPPDTGQMSDSL